MAAHHETLVIWCDVYPVNLQNRNYFNVVSVDPPNQNDNIFFVDPQNQSDKIFLWIHIPLAPYFAPPIHSATENLKSEIFSVDPQIRYAVAFILHT